MQDDGDDDMDRDSGRDGSDSEKDDDDTEVDFAEEGDEENADYDDDHLLGAKEDRQALKDVVRQFMRDDLADSGDGIVAAVRMNIHRISAFQRRFFICITFGLYLLLQPKEDQGVMLLTKKGRVINAGMSHTSEAKKVTIYACRVVFNIILIGVFLFGLAVASGTGKKVSSQAKALIIPVILLVMFLAALCLYGSRPRPDCGADFRQYFNVTDLCLSSYCRVDSWGCGSRRRRGHLRLCFGKYYPDVVSLNEGLPREVPNIGCMLPAQSLGASMAGETEHSDRQRHHEGQHARRSAGGSGHEGLGPFTALALAVLGLIGGFYEYITVANEVRDFKVNVCYRKVKGCNWVIPNLPRMGQKRRPEGASPPWNYLDPYSEDGCDRQGEVCNMYYRPVDYCSEQNNPVTIVEVKLACDGVEKIRQLLAEREADGSHERATPFTRKRLGGSASGSGISYIIKKTEKIASLPVTGLPEGGDMRLQPGMRLLKIGPSTTMESAKLERQEALNWQELKENCDHNLTFGGSMRFVFEKKPEMVDLQESDCVQMQEACKAESFGPDVNGWMPPQHLLSWTRKRTVCFYKPDYSQLLNGDFYWHEVEAVQRGLTCHGEPMGSFKADGEPACKEACQDAEGCQYAFYAEPKQTFDAPLWLDQLRSFNDTSWAGDNCLLYADCPEDRSSQNYAAHFDIVACNSPISGLSDGDHRYSSVEKRLQKMLRHGDGADDCMQACWNIEDEMCNAFSVDYMGGKVECTLYGSHTMPEMDGWTRLDLEPGRAGVIGRGDDDCWIRQHVPANRIPTGTQGTLHRRSQLRYCSGCTAQSIASYVFEWQNFSTVLAQVISVLGFAYVVRSVNNAEAPAGSEFTGKPMVDLEIIFDAKNREDFEQREAAYKSFLTQCSHLKRSNKTSDRIDAEDMEKDCWERSQDAWEQQDHAFCRPVQVVGKTFDNYELTDLKMRRCFVDRELLGLLPEEKVLEAWPERQRIGFWKLPVCLLIYLILLLVAESSLPEDLEYDRRMMQARLFLYVIIPATACFVFYIEYRQGINGLCVVTNGGRFLQITRRPLRLLCPHLFSSQSLRLDSFHVGKIFAAQLDMAAIPHSIDKVEQWPAPPGRRGKVTIRGEHGFLEVHRRSGDAFTVFHALSPLVDSKRVDGLPHAQHVDAELLGVYVARDLHSLGEKHVWTHRFDSVGFYGDAFNYSSLLSITDRRTIIVRARIPKSLSLRGIFVGPRTCGMRCMCLQELLLGHTPYLTVCTLGHNHLESYATQRKRAPPFWPGLLSPVTACSVSLLPSFMKFYPSGFSVSQRPYGLERKVRTSEPMTLKPTTDGKLFVSSSWHRGAPRGQVVESVNGDLCEDLLEDGTVDQVDVEPGSNVLLEAAAEEWQSLADEAWLAQVRAIYDHILGRTGESISEERFMFDAPEQPKPPARPGCCKRLWAHCVGHEMLGLHHDARDLSGNMQSRAAQLGEDSEDDSEDASHSYKLMK